MKAKTLPPTAHRIFAILLGLALLLSSFGSPALTGPSVAAQTAALPAGAFVAFGPQNYVRVSGGPSTFVTNFDLLNPHTAYTLQIYNGGIDSSFQPIFNPISSAVITLNGVQVAGPSDFNKQVSLIQKPVTPLASNELAVELRSGPGAGLTIQLIGIDQDLPAIGDVVEPDANDAGWHNTDVVVRFVCKDATSPIVSCTAPVTVSLEGAGQVVTGTAVDSAGNSATASATINLDKTAPVISELRPADGDTVSAARPVLSASFADALSGVNPAAVQVALDGVDITAQAQVSAAGFSLTPEQDLAGGSHTLTVVTGDAAGNSAVATSSFTVQVVDGLPPDPADIAPPIDLSVATDVAKSTEFLYTGDNPIQTGVVTGTIEITRGAVLRGRVLQRDGAPLTGVTITIKDHPELGQTLSRVDGAFDMAVNGGAALVVNYEKEGFLPAQRQVDVAWQSFASLPDVVLIPLDSQVTPIDLTAPDAIQVARGSAVSDEDGARQATLLFQQGTQAEMVLPDGSTQALTTLNVRATEYTVGESGHEAMPGELPAQSGYTYAAEFSVDEALAAGASEVRFSQPVFFYLENFLNFPVGGIVPVGYYDRAQGKWVASQNGRIIEIVSITDGLADVDTDGDGQADDGAGLGITEAERAQLAQLYTVGQSLWRVPITHFTPWDCNWPFGPPPDAVPPLPTQCLEQGLSAEGCRQLQDERQQDKPEDEPCESLGSIIECQNQTLRERIGVAGTPFSLNYASDRAPARANRTSLQIPVSAPQMPSSLKRIELEISVAGQIIQESFEPGPNLSYSFNWDGRDAYGRLVQGTFPVTIRHKHVYDGYYLEPGQFAQSFARVSSTRTIISGIRANNEVKLESSYAQRVGAWDARGVGLAGWTLSEHHTYDDAGQVIYRGDGTRISAKRFPELMVNRIAGTGVQGFGGTGGPADQARLNYPFALAVSSDGSVYIAETTLSDITGGIVRRIAPNGNLERVAGRVGLGSPGDGEGGPATEAFIDPRDLALDAQGNLYLANTLHHCVSKIDADGIITTVAGICGQPGTSGDGGPATEALLNLPLGIVVAPDGSIFISDNSHRVRQVGPDGIITTVAGTGVAGFSGDGGPATQAQLFTPTSLALGLDGTLYIADMNNARIRAVRSDGTIVTVAGSIFGFGGDGGPATQARLNKPADVVVANDGSLYIVDQGNFRIRRVGANGVIRTIAGFSAGSSGDGGPAFLARFRQIHGAAISQDGKLLVADTFNHVIRSIRPPLPEFLIDNFLLPSGDESEIYEFDRSGRHLRTFDGLTGAVRWTFGYTEQGLLATIADANGNVTTIERDADGNPIAIVAPFGQRTTLTVDSAGQLASLTDPAGQSYGFTYYGGGLLATLTDPRGQVYSFTYDGQGRLTRDSDPAGGFTALNGVPGDTGFTVTHSTAENRVTTFRVEELPNGDARRTTTDPSGAVSTVVTKRDGSQELNSPDGSRVTLSHTSDPRWGLLALTSPSATIRLPAGGLTHTSSSQRTITLADPGNPLSLQSLTDTLIVNGRTYTSGYDATARTLTSTSPEGRQMISLLDEQGRVVEARLDPALAPTRYTYDERGRLQRSERDGHTLTYAYDERGRVASITDAAGNAVRYEYDDADRLIRKILPSQRAFQYSYDANGNLTSVTLPSGAVHQLSYTQVNQGASYTAPGSAAGIARAYNLDRGLELLTLAGGRAVDYSYDSGGRITGLTYPEATVGFSYSDATGRVRTISRTPAAGQAQSITYSYNGFLVTNAIWSGAANGSFAYTYDNNFFLTGLSIDGAALPIARDRDGLVTGYGPFTFGRGGPSGAQSRIQDGALTIDLSYDQLARLDARTHTVGGQAIYALDLEHENVGHSRAGRIERKVETVAGQTSTYTYTYDLDGQLIAVHRDGALVEEYTYDSDGNRTATLAGSAEYDSRGLLSRLGDVAYEFDADGFLARRGADTFEYGSRGELLQVTLGDGRTISYSYDGLGRRIARTDAAGTIQYLYGDPGNPFRVTHARDRAGALIALFYDEAGYLFAFEQGGARFYVATDQVGTPRVVTDASGAVVKVLEYDSFGVLLADSNPGMELLIGYAGGLADPATGLVRFGWRDYEPAAGRWTARDPILFDGGQENLYVYVGNDPINLRDPLGLFCIGGSLYALIGGGAEICFNSNGDFSICGEIGLGAGGNYGISSEDPRRNGNQIKAEAEASCLGLGAKVGVALKDCGDFDAETEGGIGPFKFSPDKAALEGGKQPTLKNRGIDTKCGIGGKVAAKFCGGF